MNFCWAYFLFQENNIAVPDSFHGTSDWKIGRIHISHLGRESFYFREILFSSLNQPYSNMLCQRLILAVFAVCMLKYLIGIALCNKSSLKPFFLSLMERFHIYSHLSKFGCSYSPTLENVLHVGKASWFFGNLCKVWCVRADVSTGEFFQIH